MHLIWSKIHKIVVIPPHVFLLVLITWPISLSWLAKPGYLSCEDLMKCAGGLIMKPPQLPRIISDSEECFLYSFNTASTSISYNVLYYFIFLGLWSVGKIRKIFKFIFLLIIEAIEVLHNAMNVIVLNNQQDVWKIFKFKQNLIWIEYLSGDTQS